VTVWLANITCGDYLNKLYHNTTEYWTVLYKSSPTHNVTGFIWYVVRAGTTFYLHSDDARLVNYILYIVTILANYFTCTKYTVGQSKVEISFSFVIYHTHRIHMQS